MKKKTLAAASLLLALLMPLGATPLAVYADEAQMEISAVSEDPEEKDNGNTNENSDGKDNGNTNENPGEKDNGNTNDGSEADEAAATVGIAPQAASTYVAWIGNVGYTTLEAAVNDAPINESTEIRLGEGTYTLYTKGAKVRYKNLTFVGAGRDKTTWLVGPKVPNPPKVRH